MQLEKCIKQVYSIVTNTFDEKLCASINKTIGVDQVYAFFNVKSIINREHKQALKNLLTSVRKLLLLNYLNKINSNCSSLELCIVLGMKDYLSALVGGESNTGAKCVKGSFRFP